MNQRIGILFIASALIVAVHSNVLKCYMCASLMDKGCDSALTTNYILQPMECTGSNIIDWQNKIKQHKFLKSFANLLEVDEIIKHDWSTRQVPMACAKMIVNGTNQKVIMRMCQTAKTDSIDPCEVIERKMNNQQLGKMEHCTLCLHDACNGTTVISPEIFYTLLSFLGALIHVFYHWA